MKAQTILFLLCLVASPATLAAKEAAPTEEAATIAEISALVSDFVEHSDQAAKHERFWASDLVYTSSSGEVTDKASILASMASAPPPAADKPAEPSVRFTAEDILVRPYGDAAAVTFRLVAHTPDGQRSFYRNSGMLLRREGQWQIVTWQATKVPEPAKP